MKSLNSKIIYEMREPNDTEILGAKLCAIRLWKGMSQSEILRFVYPEKNEAFRALISQYESGRNTPPLRVLLRYARLAKISTDIFCDDESDLPAHITENIEQYDGDIRRKRETEMHKTPVEKDAVEKENKEQIEDPYKGQETIDDQKNEVTAASKVMSVPTQLNEIKINNVNETAPIERLSYREEFLNISFALSDEQTEPTILPLPSETLDQLHDMHLELLTRTPRFARPALTIEGIVNFCIKLVLANYHAHGDESLVYQQSLLLWFARNKPAEGSPLVDIEEKQENKER